MNKIISHFILSRASVFFLLTVLSCSPENSTAVTPSDCSDLITEISNLNNDSKYCIPLWINLVLLFSDKTLNEIRTSYDDVFIYLLGKYNIFTDEKELVSAWNSQHERIIKSIQWEEYKMELQHLGEIRCHELLS
jgi:hypothetical protein